MSRKRDDFNKPTKRILQERVGNRCSNPECRCLTSGPNYEPEKATRIGVAAHITAASKGGPRFNPNLKSEDRSHISNGIWLCQNCAKLVDSDEQIYTVSLLVEWKQVSEENCRRELEGKPPIEFPPEEGWICGHCRSYVEHLQTVCTGCRADVVYSATRQERFEARKMGLAIGGFISMFIFIILPQILNSQFEWAVPPGFGIGIYAVIIAILLTLAGGFIGVEIEESRYYDKPPRFIRKTAV